MLTACVMPFQSAATNMRAPSTEPEKSGFQSKVLLDTMPLKATSDARQAGNIGSAAPRK